MDAFFSYKDQGDHEKTTFIIEEGLSCYQVMPSGLKNAEATYQRLVNRIFREQIRRGVEVYVDDILVKSATMEEHVQNLSEAFAILRAHNMKLNPEKCAFGVQADIFLDFMILEVGIEVNLEKIYAILEISPLRTIKDIQCLMGRITEESQAVFEKLKSYLTSPPLLKSPRVRETLYLYLATSEETVAMVLVRTKDVCQFPYSKTEKFIFTLIVAAHKLHPYFKAHPVVVLTNQPVKEILSKADTSWKVTKWSIELAQFGVEFALKTTIKGQILANFIVECSFEKHVDPTSNVAYNLKYYAINEGVDTPDN
ncbi:protein SRG1 [Gossypium australe]|uniref:Protein SRG1 n=1 Tax=Gossypium australe TaxID=47621 RepID=A0A5B6VZL5_9ROSI|nr:protein SRG1 [Gossypium australe]